MPAPSAPRRLFGTFALLLALAAFPVGAWASHDFADVPDSNLFHADISALVDAGVTFGCGGGNYCPGAFVTREQMAAFMNRLGALAPGKVPVVNADRIDGLDSTAFSTTSHNHTGTYLPIAGTAVNSGLLDSLDSTAFATASHNHTGTYLPIAGKAADSGLLDGLDSTAFSTTSHNHTGTYLPIAGKAADSSLLDGFDSSDFLADSTNQVSYRCNAYDMLPSENYDYTIAGGYLSFPSTSAAAGCGLQLPAGATIVGGSWRLRDDSATAEVASCAMSAFDADGAETTILTATGTGVALTPGYTTLADTSVETGWETVDNATYTYALRCSTDAAALDVGFIWFQVDVEVTGLPLP